ncbi:NLR family CARD domain-containing protein 4 [Holothuria leucospilota]|uniref:NLR family CARD domain-containing protein 4 n=1 Tax=Holothuria leucospilota TaxID=206669 RepID=A0A9Q0YN24_HOLLE|nr:NLR family CARD domain-containing protein 4 [Holothuria leucospilota]
MFFKAKLEPLDSLRPGHGAATPTPRTVNGPESMRICLNCRTSQHFCDTPQYLELGKIGTINCSIPHNFHAISWYNSTNYNSEFPVIFIANSVKDGFGYITGEYDITLDGSLTINKVLPKHDRYFTLLLLFEETRNQVISMVRVVVTANVLKQTRLELLCTSNKISFFIWKRRQPADNMFRDLCFGVLAGEKYTELFSDQFDLAESGSLIIPSVNVKDEGLYSCISSDGLTNQAVVYNVTVDDVKGQFLKELTEKYKDLYNGVQPIPYLRHNLHRVDKVFVDANIEVLVSLEGGDHNVWQDIGSYHNIFSDSRAKSTRRIIEGEPGYGKTMITLRLAYDWCNRNESSVLGDVDVLILLRLRQLHGVRPIYRVIKQFLLPKDSRISEVQIQKILSESKKVLVLLDGFDEYSDLNDDAQSDINDILERKMFQEFDVILTTRSLVLPRKVSPLTKRLKLGGFDEKAQKCYTQKPVVSLSDDVKDKITQSIKNNPTLSDLCQVPLFFVIFAHMMNKSNQFQNLNSVTSLFHYMISCFHSHMEKKMEDENVYMFTKPENGDHNFTKMAFEYLRRSNKSVILTREEVRQEVGRDEYERYLRIGILVEEEMVDIIDEKRSASSGSIKTLTKVRFFHKIFCEWYAAHYLADYLQQHSSLDLSEFLQLHDPADLQYLYRFACGLYSSGAGKIIDYLQKLEGGDKFAILCILEKTRDVKDIMEQVRQLCTEKLVVSGYDSLLLQRSYLQLLELAAKNDIGHKFTSCRAIGVTVPLFSFKGDIL